MPIDRYSHKSSKYSKVKVTDQGHKDKGHYQKRRSEVNVNKVKFEGQGLKRQGQSCSLEFLHPTDSQEPVFVNTSHGGRFIFDGVGSNIFL